MAHTMERSARPTRIPLRLPVLAAAAGLSAAALLVSPAQAAPASSASPEAAIAVAERLGSRSAGVYRDASTGDMAVTVTTAADAQRVRAVGAAPKRVSHSGADLARVTTALDRSARVPGTSWSVQPQDNQVVVTVDSTVTGADLASIRRITAPFGDAARVERVAGPLSTMISGGKPIYTGGSRCSLGFNVTKASGKRFFFTAGHCAKIAGIGGLWYNQNSVKLGPTVGFTFPGKDWGLVRHDNTLQKPGGVWLYDTNQLRDIKQAGAAFVGQYVARSGSTSGTHRGYVTGINATVNYPQGTVSGLIKTDVCAEPGDSGGPLFNGSTALGLTSGGVLSVSQCPRQPGQNPITYYEPMTRALRDNPVMSIY
ncbi:MAG: trypsin-like serine protease [Micromonosporaceae bacterium]|nr:trypsin-like serine protease [Micromonosporaceae bacterium]